MKYWLKRGEADKATWAGVDGIGPSSQVLETRILPLNYTPIARLILAESKVVGWFFREKDLVDEDGSRCVGRVFQGGYLGYQDTR